MYVTTFMVCMCDVCDECGIKTGLNYCYPVWSTLKQVGKLFHSIKSLPYYIEHEICAAG